jgi:hypothetical protein
MGEARRRTKAGDKLVPAGVCATAFHLFAPSFPRPAALSVSQRGVGIFLRGDKSVSILQISPGRGMFNGEHDLAASSMVFVLSVTANGSQSGSGKYLYTFRGLRLRG